MAEVRLESRTWDDAMVLENTRLNRGLARICALRAAIQARSPGARHCRIFLLLEQDRRSFVVAQWSTVASAAETVFAQHGRFELMEPCYVGDQLRLEIADVHNTNGRIGWFEPAERGLPPLPPSNQSFGEFVKLADETEATSSLASHPMWLAWSASLGLTGSIKLAKRVGEGLATPEIVASGQSNPRCVNLRDDGVWWAETGTGTLWRASFV
jgi:hypothetical protein